MYREPYPEFALLIGALLNKQMTLSRDIGPHEKKVNFQQLDEHLQNALTFWRRRVSKDLLQSRDLIIRGIRTGKYTTRTLHIPRLAFLHSDILSMIKAADKDGHKQMRGMTRRHKPKRVEAFAIDPRPSAARRGYDRQWRNARLEYLSKNKNCVVCKRKGKSVKATVIDHRSPHRGSRKKFLDKKNWQALCRDCHAAKIGQEKIDNRGANGNTGVALNATRVARFQEGDFTPARAIKALRDRAFFVSGALDGDLVTQTRNALVLGLRNGESLTQTVNKVTNIFAPYVGDRRKLEDGKPITPYRAETIVRTNYTEAFNQGILNESHELDPDGEFIEGFEFSAILDTRTTEVCTYLDGRVFRADDPELRELAPPRHFNCRSILVPVFLDEEVEPNDVVTPVVAATGLELSGEGFGRPTVRKTPTTGDTAAEFLEHWDDWHGYGDAEEVKDRKIGPVE